MKQKTKFKKSIKAKILKNNLLVAKLADINGSFTPAIHIGMKRDSEKLLHIDFLNEISEALNLPLHELTEKYTPKNNN